MNNLECLYREHPNIKPTPLHKLSPTTYHMDGRWEWRDLPSLQKDGLIYPILYRKVTPEWWNKTFTNAFKHLECWDKIKDPKINEDGMIWSISLGNNRIICAEHLGYDHIDAIFFDNLPKLVKYTHFIKEQNPYKA